MLLGHAGYLSDFPEHIALISMLAFGYSPILYFYVLLLTGKKKKFILKDLLHALPSCIALIIIVIVTGIESLNKKIDIIPILMIPLLMHYFSYMVIIVKTVLAHINNLKNNFSSLEKINLKWILLLIGLNLITWIIGGTLNILIPHEELNWNYVWGFVSLYIYLIGYFALNQLPVPVYSIIEPERPEKEKYKKSTIKIDGFCPFAIRNPISSRALFQTLSISLQNGIRFFHILNTVAPKACLTVCLPYIAYGGETAFPRSTYLTITDTVGEVYTPVIRQFRAGTLKTCNLITPCKHKETRFKPISLK